MREIANGMQKGIQQKYERRHERQGDKSEILNEVSLFVAGYKETENRGFTERIFLAVLKKEEPVAENEQKIYKSLLSLSHNAGKSTWYYSGVDIPRSLYKALFTLYKEERPNATQTEFCKALKEVANKVDISINIKPPLFPIRIIGIKITPLYTPIQHKTPAFQYTEKLTEMQAVLQHLLTSEKINIPDPYVVGDLHANPFKFLCHLANSGIIENTEENQEILNELCLLMNIIFQFIDNKKDFQSCLAQYKDSAVSFDVIACHIYEKINKLELKENDTPVFQLIGDVFADRRGIDPITLAIFKKLQENQINIKINLGNHDLEFITKLNQKNDPLNKKKSNDQFQSAKYLDKYSRPDNRTGHNDHVQNNKDDFVNYVLPYIEIASFDKHSNTLFTHAPFNLDIYNHLLNLFNLNKQGFSLVGINFIHEKFTEESINLINDKLRKTLKDSIINNTPISETIKMTVWADSKSEVKKRGCGYTVQPDDKLFIKQTQINCVNGHSDFSPGISLNNKIGSGPGSTGQEWIYSADKKTDYTSLSKISINFNSSDLYKDLKSTNLDLIDRIKNTKRIQKPIKDIIKQFENPKKESFDEAGYDYLKSELVYDIRDLKALIQDLEKKDSLLEKKSWEGVREKQKWNESPQIQYIEGTKKFIKAIGLTCHTYDKEYNNEPSQNTTIALKRLKAYLKILEAINDKLPEKCWKNIEM